MKRTYLGLAGLLLLSACSTAPHTASFNGAGSFGGIENAAAGDSCSALGLVPGSAQYSQCEENLRIREEITARKAFNGNKNQPDGVMAQTYGRRMDVMINCTSYQGHTPGAPTLCD